MTTPMRRQYLELKAQHPDTLLLFRLGDFYEAFDEDAKVLAEVCEVSLTARPVGKNQRVPLAGVPYHALATYLEKLMAHGLKVAIAEQISPPGKGLVEREISQVMTPGTVTTPALLTSDPNILVALYLDPAGAKAGLAHGDLSVGHLAATQLESKRPAELVTEVVDELMRLGPTEILLPSGWQDHLPGLGPALDRVGSVMSETDVWIWEAGRAAQQLKHHFQVRSLAGFGLEEQAAAVSALGGLLHYVQTFQPKVARHLTRLQTYAISDFMVLDEFTRLNLELTQNLRDRSSEGSLLAVLDRTLTPMGGRLLRQWLGQPLLDVAQINLRLDAVDQLFGDGLARRGLQDVLKQIGDLDRWVQRVIYNMALPRDLVGIRQTLETLPVLAKLLGTMTPGPIATILAGLPDMERLRQLLLRALAEDAPATLSQMGIIQEGFSAELDALVQRTRAAKNALARMEETERKRLNIPRVKVGYNRVFGYYIEIPRSQSDQVPPDYIRRQTLANAERFVTEALKEYETLILHADEQQLALEQQLFADLCTQVQTHQQALQELAGQLARLDVFAALAATAADGQYVRPEMADAFELRITGGRHPVVERALSGRTFVPNDLQMDPDGAVQILTGPNMAGKSTYLRQVALIVLMAQMGSFVPAQAAHIGVVDRIFTRIGASDAIQRGLSTFMVEMIETAHILNHATRRSLLVLDEIGRGTSTYDGLAIAWAILEYIHNAGHLGAKTLFATHFHELTDLAARLPHIRNYHAAVDDTSSSITFLHTIREGRAERSFGVHVGRMAGLPQAVVERAEKILDQLEASGAAVPTSLETVWEQVEEGRAVQPALYLQDHPAVTALQQLQVDGITPLEAMNQLYALVKLVRDYEQDQ